MRMKRFLSLMLATLMLASMTISVSAATVYYTQDFSSYANGEAVLFDLPETYWATAKIHTSAVSIRSKAAETGKNFLTSADYGAKTTEAGSTLTTDDNGIKWFRFIGNIGISGNPLNYDTYLIFAPTNTWNYIVNNDETFVISYDAKVNPVNANEATRNVTSPQKTMWTNAEGTTSDDDEMFALRSWQKSTGIANLPEYGYLTINNGQTTDAFFAESDTATLANSTEINKMYADRRYKLSATYKYDENLTWPHRETIVDGVVYGSADTRNYSAYTDQNNPVLAAFMFSTYVYQGQSLANLRMYTVNDSEVFNFSVVDSEIDPMDKVAIKFSMPVCETTFKPSNITLMKDGSAYAECNVGEIKTVVENGSIYSVCEIYSKFGFEAGEYQIVLSDGVKNDLGDTVTVTSPQTFTVVTPSNTVSFAENTGGSIGSSSVSKFTAKSAAGNQRSYVIIGIYNGTVLESYAFALVNENEEISLGAKLDDGRTVKALNCGNLINIDSPIASAQLPAVTE